MRRVARHQDAIAWMADNDDTEWLDAEHGAASVTLCLVADIFGRTVKEATADLRKTLLRKALTRL